MSKRKSIYYLRCYKLESAGPITKIFIAHEEAWLGCHDLWSGCSGPTDSRCCCNQVLATHVIIFFTLYSTSRAIEQVHERKHQTSFLRFLLRTQQTNLRTRQSAFYNLTLYSLVARHRTEFLTSGFNRKFYYKKDYFYSVL
jgi:hypothetical protein